MRRSTNVTSLMMIVLQTLTMLILIMVVDPCTGNAIQHKYTSIHECKPVTTPTHTTYALWMLDCIRQCSQDVECSSATFDDSSNLCYMFSGNEITCTETAGAKGVFLSAEINCLNNGTFDEIFQTCKCYNGYIGDRCERIMIDCSHGHKSGHYNNDTYGIYIIKPVLAPEPFDVQCNMLNGGTYVMTNSKWWTAVDRNLNWENYTTGFGESLLGNHWLGLQNIYYITSSRPQHLFIDVFSDINYKGRYRKYEHFKVEDETTNYRMTYSGSFPWTQTEAAADPDWKPDIEPIALGDSMVGLNGSAFSTYDRDNDLDPSRNCALDYIAGWWHNACADCNPNGPMKVLRSPSAVDEVFWKYDFLNNEVPFVQLMLRAV